MQRTKVECAGLCLSTENCNSFYWEESYTRCQMLQKGELCMDQQNIHSVVIYAKINDLPPPCPSKRFTNFLMKRFRSFTH